MSGTGIRRAFFALAIGLGLLAVPQSTNASPILLVDSNGILTGAQNVVVGDSLYNVQFEYGECPAIFGSCTNFQFSTEPDAVAASQALLDQVFVGTFDSNPSTINGCQTTFTCYVSTPFFGMASPGLGQPGVPAFSIRDVNAVNGASETQDFVVDPIRATFYIANVPNPADWAVWSLASSGQTVTTSVKYDTKYFCGLGTGYGVTEVGYTACGTSVGYPDYSYFFPDLPIGGHAYVPILDPSGFLASSFDTQLIIDPLTIAADWPGPGHTIPNDKLSFLNPPALLEFTKESGDPLGGGFDYYDLYGPINGPILVGGDLIDPPVAGLAVSAPEPATIALFGAGLAGTLAMRRRRGAKTT